MTIDELWNNLKTILESMDNRIGNLETDMKEVKSQLKYITEKEIPEMKEQLKCIIEREIPEIKEQLKQIPIMQRDIRNIKNVNFPTLMKCHTQLRQEIKNLENKLTKKIDSCMKEANVKHKEFDYRISKLEWKTQGAN